MATALEMLTGRLVELRPRSLPPGSAPEIAARWDVRRVPGGEEIGSAWLQRTGEAEYQVTVGLVYHRSRYRGGFGAEAFELASRHAFDHLGAEKVWAATSDQERRAAMEQAGFRVVWQWPARSGWRRHRHPWFRLERERGY